MSSTGAVSGCRAPAAEVSSANRPAVLSRPRLADNDGVQRSAPFFGMASSAAVQPALEVVASLSTSKAREPPYRLCTSFAGMREMGRLGIARAT